MKIVKIFKQFRKQSIHEVKTFYINCRSIKTPFTMDLISHHSFSSGIRAEDLGAS